MRLRITKKADQIRILFNDNGVLSISKRFIAMSLLKYAADNDGELTEAYAIGALAQIQDGSLGSGTPTSFVKAFIRRGYLEVV